MIRHRRVVSIAAVAFAAAGVVLLGYVAWVSLDAGVYQEQARAALVVVEAQAQATGQSPRVDGDLLGEIAIARIGLRAVITEGASDAILRRGVGHVPDTAAPGAMGNAALAAHRDGIFRPLRNVRVGDVITVTAGGSEVDYDVEWTRIVSPGDVWVMGPTSGRALTLITCYPFWFIGSAPDRFIVRARQRPAQVS